MRVSMVKFTLASLALLLVLAPGAQATLLLSLDARMPGSSPASQWEDLTGQNQPFSLNAGNGGLPFIHSGWGPSPPDPAYQLYDKSFILGNVADEGNFDFGLGDAFTVVTRSNHSSAGSNHLGVSKGNMTTQHWAAGGGLGNEVAAIDIGADNGGSRNYVRAYHPGNNPQPIPSDGDGMATYVFHFDGTGFGQIYIDGVATTNNIFANTGGSPLNNEPLRLGIPNGPGGGAPAYNGRLQFVEIWSGSTVAGMTPAAYAAFRAANTDLIRIPEPTSLCLLALGGLALAVRRRVR